MNAKNFQKELNTIDKDKIISKNFYSKNNSEFTLKENSKILNINNNNLYSIYKKINKNIDTNSFKTIDSFNNNKFDTISKDNLIEYSRPISKEKEKIFISSNNANFNFENHAPQNLCAYNSITNKKLNLTKSFNDFQKINNSINPNSTKNINGIEFKLIINDNDNRNDKLNKNSLDSKTEKKKKITNEKEKEKFKNFNEKNKNSLISNNSTIQKYLNKNEEINKIPIILKYHENFDLNKIDNTTKLLKNNYQDKIPEKEINLESYYEMNHLDDNIKDKIDFATRNKNLEPKMLQTLTSHSGNLSILTYEDNLKHQMTTESINSFFSNNIENPFEIKKNSSCKKNSICKIGNEIIKVYENDQDDYNNKEYENIHTNRYEYGRNVFNGTYTQTDDIYFNTTCPSITKNDKPKKIVN